MNDRRISLDEQGNEKPIVREISIFELMERLSRYKDQSLTLAKENDYDCYYMSYHNYEEDIKNNVFHIGYSADVIRNGINFHTVCTIKDGKIEGLDLKVSHKTINLSRLYIDNLLGKNKIVFKTESKGYEMPY